MGQRLRTPLLLLPLSIFVFVFMFTFMLVWWVLKNVVTPKPRSDL